MFYPKNQFNRLRIDNSVVISRRTFIGLFASLITACVTGTNRLTESFSWKSNLIQGYTPGICYSVMPNREMVASSNGVVSRVNDLGSRPGRTGGLMITISYPDMENTIYYVRYAHLTMSFVQVNQSVERGTPIAIPGPEYANNTKLMLQEKFGANWINPDQYGINQGPMQFYDGISNFEVENPGNKLKKQKQIIIDMQNAYNGPKKEFVENMDLEMHRSYGPNLCRWSDVDKLNYIKSLHIKDSEHFNMSENSFRNLIKEFYDNQAIILTLPFLSE